MPSNQQRRDAERRRLQRQLEERRAREATRKRTTLIGSIVGTLVIIAVIVVVVVATSGGSGKKKPSADQAGGIGASVGASSPASQPSSAAASTVAPTVLAPNACATPPKGATATFDGVTVTNPTDLKHAPKVTSAGTVDPNRLECMDLVVGAGPAATPTSSVTVQYSGVLYKGGTAFDSSWSRGQAAQFSLTGVVPGFTEGIGGIGKVDPMKVGGRRIIIMPSTLGYGTAAQSSIPANSPLVFIVDLTKVG